MELTVAAKELADQDEQEKIPTLVKPSQPVKKPRNFPRVRIEHDLSDSKNHRTCGCELSIIGEETSEQLGITPTKIQVLVNVRKKYTCKWYEEGVKTSSLPKQPIPKSNASLRLLVHIAVSKYQDALPLYRLESILKRSGVEILRSTLAKDDEDSRPYPAFA